MGACLQDVPEHLVDEHPCQLRVEDHPGSAALDGRYVRCGGILGRHLVEQLLAAPEELVPRAPGHVPEDRQGRARELESEGADVLHLRDIRPGRVDDLLLAPPLAVDDAAGSPVHEGGEELPVALALERLLPVRHFIETLDAGLVEETGRRDEGREHGVPPSSCRGCERACSRGDGCRLLEPVPGRPSPDAVLQDPGGEALTQDRAVVHQRPRGADHPLLADSLAPELEEVPRRGCHQSARGLGEDRHGLPRSSDVLSGRHEALRGGEGVEKQGGLVAALP